MLVCAGQSALTDVPLLQKLMDRFTIRVPLSDVEVETVTRKVLLQKKPTAIGDVRALLETHAGEVSRQLQGTRIAEVAEDRQFRVDDYPLLPVRRRFWEHCFRQIDAAGTKSQLRSQLRIIHDAVARLSDKPMSAIVPADDLFDALAPEMVNTGVLLHEINELILRLGKEDDLARRICGLVFLIGKLRREAEADIGVRANRDHVADLLVSDLAADNGKLRSEVEATLAKLVDQGVLMRLGDEFRLQTRAGTEWDREFKIRQTKLGADQATVQQIQDQLIYAEIDNILRAQRIAQGAAKEPRPFIVHRELIPPPVDGTAIPVWIRDGWSCSQSDVVTQARTAGIDNPIVSVFIAKQDPENLKRLLIEIEAAKHVIETKGATMTDEARDARTSMESRRDRAHEECKRLIAAIVANAKVFQGGGREVLSATLPERLKTAADDSLLRLFPRFKEADSASWELAIKRAKEGGEHPFQPVGHSDATEKHPVCQQVLSMIGTGKTGSEIRKVLRSSPFGWPQDAIDAALIAMHRSQHVTATLNGTPVQLGQLDQNKIAKSEFRSEAVTLSMQDRIRLRQLFQSAQIACKTGEESTKATEFIQKILETARSAGGQPPMPLSPSTLEIEDIQKLPGNAQLAALKEKAAGLEENIKSWTTLRDLATARKPAWEILERMSAHAAQLPAADPVRSEMSAIRDKRLLLEPTDPVVPLRQQLSKLLREATADAVAHQQSAHVSAMRALVENETWKRLPEADRSRILAEVSLSEPLTVDVSTDERLVTTLDQRNLSGIRAECDAIPGRVIAAVERAARLLEPKVQPIAIERITLRTEADLDAWLDRQRKTISAGLKLGPVLVS
jgi:hypothetical protein